MPTLTITKTYSDGVVLTEADLDNIKDDVETFLNVTKIDSANIQADGVTATELRDDASIDGNRSVTTDHIRDASVTAAKLAPGAGGISAEDVDSIVANAMFNT